MVLSTGQLRVEYAPACKAKDGLYLEAYDALDACFKKHQYAVRKKDTGAYNCRVITGGSLPSLHSYGPGPSFEFWTGVRIATSLAVDINWLDNPYGPRLVTDMPRAMIDDIYLIRTNSGAQVWRWGGYYTGSKDAMHFEVVCTKADLKSGIKQSTVPAPGPAPVPDPVPTPPPVDLEDAVFFAKCDTTTDVFLFESGRFTHIKSRPDLESLATALGLPKVEATVSFATWTVLIKDRTQFR